MFKKHAFSIVFFSVLLLFSFWLMWQTFGYRDSTIYLSLRVWSDFAANLPLIRSFSLGNNFPPEYPIFPGEPIRYHFLFYLLVGLLEKAGLRLDWALNLPSALSFFFLLVMIFLFAKYLFKSKITAFLSVIFFLFNGTFSFIYFFQKYDWTNWSNWTNLRDFVSFMPYGPGEVTAFWSLNTFVNQRHLALGFGILLLMVYLLLKKESSHNSQPTTHPYLIVSLGLLFGLFPFLHKAVFLMAILIFFCLFLFFKRLRLQICLIGLIGLICALPQLYFTNQLNTQTSAAISFYPGYLVYGQGLLAFLRHWLWNLGLNVFLIPLGFILAPRRQKAIFLAFFSLFIIGNLFKFSPEIAANHKFFNLFIIVGNMYTAYALVRMLRNPVILTKFPVILACPESGFWMRSLRSLTRMTKYLIFLFLIFFLTFSGIIDFFPIKNAPLLEIADSPKNQEAAWILKNTGPKSLFLNSSFLYHPASLAGRNIYLGWLYFVWGAGYDATQRAVVMNQIYAGTDKQSFSANKKEVCRLLTANKIDYLTIEKVENDPIIAKIDVDFFKNNFTASYSNPDRLYLIYDVKLNCPVIY